MLTVRNRKKSRNNTKAGDNQIDRVDSTAECLWLQSISELRASVRTDPGAREDGFRTLEDVTLPYRVGGVLAGGPKFAVVSGDTALELLGLARQVSGLAPGAEADMGVFGGVGVLFG